VALDAHDELDCVLVVDVAPEPRSRQHSFELGHQQRTDDDIDPASMKATMSGAEPGLPIMAGAKTLGWITIRLTRRPRCSRRDARNSPDASRSAFFRHGSPDLAWVASISRMSRYAFSARSTTAASEASPAPGSARVRATISA
jgi:hypothetical protein